MDREILFRAKRVDNGEWVRGDLLRETDNFNNIRTRIYEAKGHGTFIKHEVDPDTICQYTGTIDRKGQKVFEGDIVKTKFFGKENGKGQNFNDYDVFEVVYEFTSFRLKNNYSLHIFPDVEEIKVIGNIFENPEFISGGRK